MNKIQGTHIVITYQSSGSQIVNKFAFARQASIEMDRKMVSITSANTGNASEFTPGRISWNMFVGCLMADDLNRLFQIFRNGEKILVSFRDETPDWDENEKYSYEGYAYIKGIKHTGNINNMATCNITLQGTGHLDYTAWNYDGQEEYIIGIEDNGGLSEHLLVIYFGDGRTPLPCDIKLEYPNRFDGKPPYTFLFKKGTTGTSLIKLPVLKYDTNKFTVLKAVYNYDIFLNEV